MTLSNISAVQCYDSYYPNDDNLYDSVCCFQKSGHEVSRLAEDEFAQKNPVFRGYLYWELKIKSHRFSSMRLEAMKPHQIINHFYF